MADLLFFDLDGTLTDPYPGITNSILYALDRMGKPSVPRESLRRFIGPPLVPAFREFLGMTPEEADLALGYYREYFAARGLFENKPYPGIADALDEVRSAGKTLCLATSKPEKFAKQILEHFRLDAFFTEVCGASLDQSRSTKADVIRELIRRLGELTGDTAGEICSSAVMIGDRCHDAEGASAFGIPTVGVLWGYGSEEELTDAGCVRIFKTPREMAECLAAAEECRNAPRG